MTNRYLATLAEALYTAHGSQVRIRGWRRFGSLRDLSMLCVVGVSVSSFVLLTGSADVARLEITQTVDANYRSSYDILVRPKGSQTAVEAREGTVRPNYLSGIYGGISRKQAAKVRSIPGVEIAAPIAMVGQVIQNVWVPIDVTDEVERGASLFRFSSTGSDSSGLNEFAGPAGYTYVGEGVSQDFGAGTDIPVVQRIRGKNAVVCRSESQRRSTPFSADARWFPQCWDFESGLAGSVWPAGSGRYVVRVPLRFPVTVAAIDPQAEAALTGLDEAMIRGSYLNADSVPEPDDLGMVGPAIPVLYSTKSYVREKMNVTVDTLGADAIEQVRLGLSRAQARDAIGDAPATRTRTVRIDLAKALSGWATSGEVLPRAFYEAGQVGYTPSSAQSPTQSPTLNAQTRKVDNGIWNSTVFVGEPYAPVPWSATGPAFRELAAAPGRDPARLPTLSVRGTFDPQQLLQGTTLGKVPLETYQSPAVQAGDDYTRKALHGKSLFPGSNPAGYLQNPPLMLTSLKSLQAITDRGVYGWADAQAKSETPISVVRVRVAGVTGADETSRERVRLVAEAIQAATGLDVDITIGSSPSPTTVRLATNAGDIKVQEMWVEKGVAERVVTAIDQKSLGLFVLVLLTTALSVAISANASVRARQRELAVLACLGWRPSTLYRSVLARLLAIGAAAGILGAAASWPLGRLFDTPVSGTRALLAIPCAVALMLLVGIWPAITAARSTPAATIRNVARAPKRPRPLRGPISLGLVYLMRRPSRALTASVALAVGVAALVVLLGISQGFSGAVVGNLLGNAVALQVRSADIAAGAILCVIGMIAVLDVLVLNVKEQASGYASLQASGWRDYAVIRLVLAQGLTIATIGAGLGALIGLGILNTLLGVSSPLLTSTATVAAGSVVAGAVISAVPAWIAIHLNTARILAEEES